MNLIDAPLDCIKAGCARGRDSHPLAADAQFRRDVTYGSVGCEFDAAHHRDPLHPVPVVSNSSGFVNVTGTVHRSAKASDDPPLLLTSQINATITQGKLCCGDRKLREPAPVLSPTRVHEVLGVEGGDVVDRGLAGDEIAPEGFLADPIGGDDAQPSNNYTPGVLHQTVPPKGASVKVG